MTSYPLPSPAPIHLTTPDTRLLSFLPQCQHLDLSGPRRQPRIKDTELNPFSWKNDLNKSFQDAVGASMLASLERCNSYSLSSVKAHETCRVVALSNQSPRYDNENENRTLAVRNQNGTIQKPSWTWWSSRLMRAATAAVAMAARARRLRGCQGRPALRQSPQQFFPGGKLVESESLKFEVGRMAIPQVRSVWRPVAWAVLIGTTRPLRNRSRHFKKRTGSCRLACKKWRQERPAGACVFVCWGGVGGGERGLEDFCACFLLRSPLTDLLSPT
jgi:hypothetical protein